MDRSLFVTRLIFYLSIIAFEYFSFGLTKFALADIIGVLGSGWAIFPYIIALSFVLIDLSCFALGQNDSVSPLQFYSSLSLFFAWGIAATMNAVILWWGFYLVCNNSVLSVVLAGLTLCVRVIYIGRIIITHQIFPIS